jgi:trigger factor
LEIRVKSPKEWLREIEIEFEPEQLKSKIESLLEEYKDKAKIPGFRPGKVPKYILERRLGSALESTAAEELVEQALTEAMEKNGIKPASRLKIDDLEITPEKAIRVKASAEVIPEFELKDYTQLTLRRPKPTGFDAEFEKRIAALRERCAVFQPVSRPAAPGDYVVVDYILRENDRVVAGPNSNITIQLGDEANHPSINQALLNVHPGDERSAEITFPADHPDKNLAGRTITYHLTIRAVREKILPELNEEFAQDLGYENLDALRRALNDEILADREEQVKEELHTQIVDQLTARYQFEPPASWVQSHINRLLRELNLPDTPENRDKLLPVAVKSARFDCIVLRIAQQEKITVTDEEIETQIQTIAQTTGRKAEDIASLLDNSSYRFYILQNKVFQLLINRAEISPSTDESK